MVDKKSERFNGLSKLSGREDDEERLVQILGGAVWSPQEAAEVLSEQAKSGQSIPEFARTRALTVSRLYKWKKRLTSEGKSGNAKEVACKEAELPPRPKAAPREPSEARYWDARAYVERATGGEAPMWELHGMREEGPRLLCVVRWVQIGVDPACYSLVELSVTEPALRWRDYLTQASAMAAMQQGRWGKKEKTLASALPPLIEVKVGEQESSARAARQSALKEREAVGLTVFLSTGLRVRIPEKASEALIRTVLEVLGVATC